MILDQLKKELNKAETLEEFLSIFNQRYDTRNCKLGSLSRAMLISNIGSVINVTGVKPKSIK